MAHSGGPLGGKGSQPLLENVQKEAAKVMQKPATQPLIGVYGNSHN